MSLTIKPSSSPIGARDHRAPVPLYWVVMAGAALVLAAALFPDPAPVEGRFGVIARITGLAGLGLLTVAFLWLGLVPPSRPASG